MIWCYQIKIKDKVTDKVLYHRRVKATSFVRALQQGITSMTRKGLLKKGRKKPVKIGSLWWNWLNSNHLEITMKRTKEKK